MVLKLPSKATVIAGLVLGGVTTLLTTTLHLGGPWTLGLTIAGSWAAMFGVAPITGAAFRSALELTPAESAAAGGVLTTINLVLAEASLTPGVRGALLGVVNTLSALGFGPTAVEKVKSLRAAVAARVVELARPSSV